MPATLPQPDGEALAVSRRLTERIRRSLAAAGGWMSFERYMQHALYEPQLGYYCNGSTKFGAEGDFVTAPELSEVFARVLAAQIVRLIGGLRDPVILELGAGTGRLAESLGRALAERSVRAPYWILEPSPELRARQAARLARAGIAARWIERLPDEPSFQGLILANEVLDAFPVNVFVKRRGEAVPLGVTWVGGRFAWVEGAPQATLSDAVAALEDRLGRVLAEGYRSELSGTLPAWVRSVGDTLEKGAILAIDYGLTEREYYHPQRDGGTLMCHYRHRAHDDPFFLPGLQDISAWVDFSACARAAEAAGLDVAGFTTQGQFLVEGGATEWLPRLDAAGSLKAAQALKTLVLPGEMGERFKLLLLSRDLELDPLPGRDLRDRL